MKKLEIKNLSFGYKRKVKVLDNLSLSFDSHLTFLLGANGSGKSTLLKLILGALHTNQGEILLNGKKIPNHLRSSLIGYVPQSYALDPEMSVVDIMKFIGSFNRLSKESFVERKDFLCKQLDIGHLLNTQVKRLSGGQKQLVNIAVSLLHDPEILLLDEPFVGLDYSAKMKLISFLNSQAKIIICVSHDLEMAENYANQIVLLQNGKIQLDLPPKELIESHDAYLREIDFKMNLPEELHFSDQISVLKQENRLVLTCLNKEELRNEINAFEAGVRNQISGTRSCENNLKSTLIDKYQFTLIDKKDKKPAQKGTGQGQKRKQG